MAARALSLLLAAAMSAGCSRQDSASPPQSPPAAQAPPVIARPAPLESRLGWVTGSCLATANKSITPGSVVTVVSLDDNAALVDGRVSGGTVREATCPPLLQDRRTPNASQWSFYELKLSASVDLGIGVIGGAEAVTGGLDLNGDGAPERFSHCASSEGIWFRVWSGAPYQGTPLWSGYYYLGYDTEVTCPS